MESPTRRRVLGALTAAGTTGLAGCSALAGGVPDVDPNSELDGDPRDALANTAVFLAGDTADLPEPPSTTDSLADAEVALATPAADRSRLAAAFRDGTTVAFARGGATDALAGVLSRAGNDYTYGVETVRAKPVEPVVAVPRGTAVDTYTFVREGGWTEPVLDAVGWALSGRVPDCRTFVPESSMDDDYEYAGAAHVAGRLDSGETYASRTVASVSRQDAGRFVRLRTAMHAAANDGYGVAEAVREADFPDDERLHSVFPNPHTSGGVQVANESDSIRSTFRVVFTPATRRARGSLTGCGGLRTDGDVAYDHRTSVEWKRDRLLGTDRHYGGGTGRGEWRL